jgi:general secretion pathway protein D
LPFTERHLRRIATGLAIILMAGCATGRAFRNGQNASKRGDWDAAVAYYREALGHDPTRIDVKIALQRAMSVAAAEHIKRARDLEAQDQLAGAIAEYRLAGDLDPTNGMATSKANELDRRLRDRIEAARPPSTMARLQAEMRQSNTIPTLDPRLRVPAMNFGSAAVKDILNAIGGAAGISVTYVANIENVTGKPYSINIQDTSLEEALNQVLSNNTLTFKVVNQKTILIFPDDAPSHTKYDDLYTQTFFLSNIDVADMVQILNQMMTAPTPWIRPQISQSKSTNAIVVRATGPVLSVIEKLISSNDKPKAEVMIDVEILEVDRKRLKQLGLDLSQYALGFTFSPEVSPPNTSGTFPPATPPPFNLNTISQGVSTNDFYMTVPTAVVRFLESDQRTRTLARPQARGQEGQQLTLNLGDRIPTVNSFIPQTATQGGLFTTPSASVTYNPIGVNLTITPRVTFNDEIVLTLAVDNSGLGANIEVAGQSFPTFTARTIQTVLRLRDGESNLLAGLIREQNSRTNTGIAGLARVPFLRGIFGNVNETIDQSDVVIIVTPHIVRSHELTVNDLKPMYVGTGQNFGPPGPPPLISPEAPLPAGVTPAPAGGAGQPPVTGAAAPSAATPATRPGVVPIVPVTPVEAPPPETGAARITLTPTGDYLSGNATPYTVPITVTGLPEVGTVTLRITYNPMVLRAQTVNNGNFMNQGSAGSTFVPRIDPNSGQIDIAISRPANATGASGQGLLASIQFLAQSPGSSQLTIAGSVVSPTGQPVQVQFVPGTVVVK